MDKFFEENPGEEERSQELAAKIRDAAERHLHMSSILKEASAPITIPVVFHVLWSTARPELKLTAEQVETEMVYLNQWFSASNAYYAKASSRWVQRAVASDFKISFVLASKDPNGNPTTGIIYHESTVVDTCGKTEIHLTSEGGADAWNTLEYMNVWTCPLTNGYAGYAYMPISNTHYRDGIVIKPEKIGSDYNLGSILAHEAAHWLGVDHPFNGELNVCQNADNITDTPLTDIYAFDYISSQVCTNPNGWNDEDFQRCGNVVMFQNVMDYSWEECKALFTKGQVAIMRSWLDDPTTVRYGLRNSPGLGSVSCTPNCSGKVCGSNQCGGSCGSCITDVCSSDGTQCAATGSSSSRSPSPSPTPSPSAFVSSDATRVVIEKINTIRAQVNPPPAAPLTPLTYSLTLENQAKAQAQQCSFGITYGQTAYITSGDKTANLATLFSNAIGLWNSSSQYYSLTSSGSTCSDPSGSCGSYVQMIWNHAQYPTTQVGCAAQFCSAASRTFVVCQFSGPGNYVGLLPYVPCSSPACNPKCTASCSPGQCGVVQTECGPIDCGQCCNDPCAVNQCGSHMNSCGTAITCPNCPTGYTCTSGADRTTCVQDPVCIHADECAAAGFKCGNKIFCGVNQACGYCAAGQICSNFDCVPDPCNSCGPNSECINSKCSCLAGFVLENGICSAPSLGIDYSKMFAQISPTGSVDFVVPENDLILIASGPHVLKWVTSQNVVDLYTTKSKITVAIASGEFGFNIRTGQSGSSRVADRVMWHVKGIGSNPALAICLVYNGANYCSSYTAISFPNPANVTVTMGFDGSNILTTWQVGSGGVWSSYVSQSYYPSLGAISYFLSSSANPVLSNAILATSATLTVSLVDCIDDATWANMFYTLTGANPASVTVTARPEGENANCKAVESGKVVASGFTVVITSTSLPAAALASQLVSTVGSPAAAALGLSSASVVSGAAGANVAGFATTIATLGGIAITAPVGGGAGGGAAGLSGGAIAGIVVGSVAGAVLIVGVTTIVVAAVVVAAVIVAKKASSDDSPAPAESGPSRSEASVTKRVRDTLYDIFRAPKGGVDVMNNPDGHQSITARSPAQA